MKTIATITLLLAAPLAGAAIAQTAEPATASAQVGPLTAEEIKAIRKRLATIEREIEKEYLASLNYGGGGVNALNLLSERREGPGQDPIGRRIQVPKNLAPVSARHEELIRERTTLQAKLTAARIR